MSQIHLTECFDVRQEMQKFLPRTSGYATKALHDGQSSDKWTSGANVPPIHLTSTYKINDIENIQNIYGRYDNPNRTCLQECLASLDNAKYCLTFGSGMATMTTIFLSLKSGDHILFGYDTYGGYYDFIVRQGVAKNMGIEVSFVDMRDLELVRRNVKPNTAMAFFDTPTNPLLRVFDVKKVCELIHGINEEIVIFCDNTFLTPYFMHPLELGADVAVYSLSKYLNGHGDVIMGGLTTNNEKIYTRLKALQKTAGAIPSPFDCYMANRGLNTLSFRMEQHFRNGLIVGKFLERHPKVERVIHPGLESHSEHKIAIKQARGHSGMLSFYLKNADLKKSKELLANLKLIVTAGSLGNMKSSANIAALISSASMPKEEKEALGITDNLIRLSIGTEDPEDIVGDLQQALERL
ncbi:putative cystathionine gamma-lyase 2 [Culicoides brevitarsis]|uniref:putative cystathionine gamma-lyase 2 n=1 Tax=Culicoides brevitarsis TaxID=469753 RepID=UPI00307BC65B